MAVVLDSWGKYVESHDYPCNWNQTAAALLFIRKYAF